MEPEPEVKSELILYQTEDGGTRIEVRLQGETVWLSLNQMAELFQRDKSVISRHIRNVFEEGELRKDSVVAFFATTAKDGNTYQVEYFNLDVIISVGYRVKSQRGRLSKGSNYNNDTAPCRSLARSGFCRRVGALFQLPCVTARQAPGSSTSLPAAIMVVFNLSPQSGRVSRLATVLESRAVCRCGGPNSL